MGNGSDGLDWGFSLLLGKVFWNVMGSTWTFGLQQTLGTAGCLTDFADPEHLTITII